MICGATAAFPVLLALCWHADALVAGSLDSGVDEGTPQDLMLHSGVPANLRRLENIFKRKTKDDCDADGNFVLPKNKSASRMILGVFTTLTQRSHDIREILLRTWLLHPSVCLLADLKDENDACPIRVVFVSGDGGRVPEDRVVVTPEGIRMHKYETNVLLLPDTVENMDEGKSFGWLSFAARNFLWADYVAKCDDDVFPHVTKIIEALPENDDSNNCPHAFLGKPWTCKNGNFWCPDPGCGPPVNHSFLEYGGLRPSEECFSYMQGGFYALTRSVVLNITEPGGFFDQHQYGPEDLQTGLAVMEYTRRAGICMYVWGKFQVILDRMYFHLRARNEHPGGISASWDKFYFA